MRLRQVRSRIKYPKLLLLVSTFIIAVVFFSEARTYPPLNEFLVSLGYPGTFIAGMLYAYGFTSAPATAILLILAAEQDILLAGLVGGLGALVSDLIIYLFVRNTFADEIEKLRLRSAFFRQDDNKSGRNILKKYLLIAVGGFLIATPLPSEIGITLLASVKNLSTRRFLIVAYFLHTAGIFAILLTGSVAM
ncbi:MAG TPA: hypothetical protein VF172_06900 [Nitrososphaera sp.]|jgi:uncharacterized membrane protein YdjX (TVP38/TMEM64 family)